MKKYHPQPLYIAFAGFSIAVDKVLDARGPTIGLRMASQDKVFVK